MMSPKITYAIYCRKSTESADRQVLSIDSQIDETKKMAAELNIRVPVENIFTESKSAKTTARRPKFKEMVEKIEDGKINGIIVWNLDRI